MKICTQQCL